MLIEKYGISKKVFFMIIAERNFEEDITYVAQEIHC